MLKRLQKAVTYGVNFAKESLKVTLGIAVGVPGLHILAYTDSPKKNALGTFVIGPLAGLRHFMSDRSNIIIGATAATFTLAKTESLLSTIAVGIGANLLTGFAQSVHARLTNRRKLEKISKMGGYGVHNGKLYIMPKISGLLFEALEKDFETANQYCASNKSSQPYTVKYLEVVKAMAGIRGKTSTQLGAYQAKSNRIRS